MAKQLKDRKLLYTPLDINFILDVLALNIFGIIMIYSASYYYAVSAYHYAPDHFFMSQLKYVLIGLAAMIAISFFRPRFFQRFWWLAGLAAFGFVIAVRIPGLAHESHGAYRWIEIGGFTLQIAEPVKICLILFLAGMAEVCGITNKRVLILIIGFTTVLAGLLAVLSNNLSTAMIIMMTMYFLLMIEHPRPKGFWIVLIAGLILLVIGILAIKYVIPYRETENFRITRIRAWLYPTDVSYAGSEAYQSTQALYAIASGGFFGKGFGQSLLKFKLPEPHNDYILAIVFEETGIFGVLILTYLFMYLLYRIFRIYKESRRRFDRVLVLGVFLHLSVQILLNYAVTLGLFPTMGVTLPFISAGGSAALFSLLELGMVLSVDKQNKEISLYLNAHEAYQKRQDLKNIGTGMIRGSMKE